MIFTADVSTFYQSQYTGEQLDNILKNVYESVALDGSKAMTGPLTIKEVENGYTRLEKDHTSTSDLGTILKDVDKSGNVTALLLKAADKAARLQFGASIYDILHTGNFQPYLKPYADAAEAASEAAESALAGVKDAIDNIPEGAATPIVNDLTTGGASMALSAEMGKVLKSEVDEVAGDLAALTPEDIGAASETAAFLFRKSIPSGSDLNAIVEPGSYYVTSANASGVANMPAAYAIHLYVFLGESLNANNTSARVLQIATRSNPISTNGNILWYRVINPSDGYFGDWKTLATTDYAVNKAGDTMAGVYRYKDGTIDGAGARFFASNGFKVLMQDDITEDNSNRHMFVINPYANGLKTALQLARTAAGGTSAWYNILHTGNKPSGSYTGNGSAASRTINTGGIGDICLVWSENGSCILHRAGIWYASDTDVLYLPRSTTYFQDGVINITSDAKQVNLNGVTYYYQVL